MEVQENQFNSPLASKIPSVTLMVKDFYGFTKVFPTFVIRENKSGKMFF